MAEVWMDGYKEIFYSATHASKSNREIKLTEDDWNSINERKELRNQLGCKSFEWY